MKTSVGNLKALAHTALYDQNIVKRTEAQRQIACEFDAVVDMLHRRDKAIDFLKALAASCLCSEHGEKLMEKELDCILGEFDK